MPSSLLTIDSASEEIYPNSVDGKYFTSTQARIYVGNLFLDEMVSIQFTYQKNRIPIYGYCSELADGFGTGRALVQGQLALNFVAKGYLYTVLDEFNTINTQKIPSPQEINDGLMASAINRREDLSEQLTKAETLDQITDITTQLAAADFQITTLAKALGPVGLDLYSASLNTDDPTISAIDLDIPFDIQFQLSGAGRTITKTIKNCLLISNDQVFDQSGCVLLDAYGFVGRNVV